MSVEGSNAFHEVGDDFKNNIQQLRTLSKFDVRLSHSDCIVDSLTAIKNFASSRRCFG